MSRPRARLATLLLALSAGVLVAAAPASAAVPDKFAFVLWNGAATVATGTTPAATTVSVLSPGRYLIIFPGSAAPGGVVHVTAINVVPHWCQANSWNMHGPDEVLFIDCYKAGGTPDNTAFTAIFDSSSPPVPPINGRFGYVDSLPSGVLVSQFNSSGAVNSVSPIGVGQWAVKLPNLSTPGPVDGSLQATAVASTPARCKVAKWNSSPSGQFVYVFCFDATGAPFNTRFTLSYQYQTPLYGAGWPPKYFGYLWYAPPVGPSSTNFNSVLGAGANSLSPAGTGLYLVKFPSLGVTPDTVQVTAAGTKPDFCSLLTFWAHPAPDTMVRDVACYDNFGTPIDTGFLISANSAL